MTDAWRRSLDRARRAHSEWMAEEAADAARVYRYEVGFTIPSAVCRDCTIETSEADGGLRVLMEFRGTEEARAKVTDFIADLPAVCRSFRRFYDEAPGGVSDRWPDST